jgi:cell division GTPase FtsZ
MNELNRDQKTVRIYACGGCGTNIASTLESYRGSSDPAAAVLSISYFDTSDSNLKHHIPKEAVYSIPGKDGSGGLRSENAGEIVTRVKEALQKHQPADFNIVIHSGSGGSGSVWGPVITGELLERDAPTVVIIVGSSSVREAAKNSLNTIKSYAAQIEKHNKPIVASYFENRATIQGCDGPEE